MKILGAFLGLSLSSGLLWASSVGLPLAQYCERYVLGLEVDYSSFDNFLKLYRAAVAVSAKAHSNAEQLVGADGQASYRVYPEMDQRYGGDRYTVHLIEVESVLRRFAFRSRDSVDARILKIAARLHDTAEDTPLQLDILAKWFGDDVAALLFAVKKAEPAEAADADALKKLTIERVLSHRLGTTLKLADRIANVEKGLRSGGILPKYLRDHSLFRETLYRSGENEEMWSYLDALIEKQAFPAGREYWSSRLEGLSYVMAAGLEGPRYTEAELSAAKDPLPTFGADDRDRPVRLQISEIHFMQRYGQENMGHRKYSLIETAQDLATGELPFESLPPLEVWRDDQGRVWALDNRRLAAAVLSGIDAELPVQWVDEAKIRADSFKFEPWRGGTAIQIILEDGRVLIVEGLRK